MRRFWITFDLPPEPESPRSGITLDGDPWGWLRRGVGVTAASLEDALGLVRDELFDGTDDVPAVSQVIADVDVSTLEEGPILPNIGVVIWRGIWWPPGFTQWHEP